MKESTPSLLLLRLTLSTPAVRPMCAGNLYKAIPRLRECQWQVEAEEVSNSRNKIHQTWEWPYGDSLYSRSERESVSFDHQGDRGKCPGE